MSESRKTLTVVAVAIVLVVVAWATRPRIVGSAALQDRGQPFFPAFTDPNAASSLEVIEFDEQTSLARPFKVLNRDGRWTIPSHDNYPADASDRLSSIAAAVIALRKDDRASDNPKDEERCGVLDPLDETLPAAKGRGTRITVKGTNEKVLADIVVGKPVEGRPTLRYVRLPSQKRIYVARADGLNISTRFEDWIARNLLQVDRGDIDQILIRNYAVDAKSDQVRPRDQLVLRKTGADTWAADGAPAGGAVDAYRMNLLVTKLVELTMVDVRPKPAGIAASLTGATAGRKLLQADVADLAGKGFYLTSNGQLLSNQGEVLVHTSPGIFYVLRFGEVAYEAPAGRYLFISVGFDPNATHGTIADDVRARLDVLRARFAPWYYVVSDDDFRKIRLERRELLPRRARTTEP